MIEIDIPTIDPIQHETKIFFGLTSRQCLCAVPSVVCGVAAYMILPPDLAMPGLMTCVGIGGLMGWAKPYNMKFEQFAKLWWFNNFVANSKRIYKTDREVEQKNLTIKERQALEKRKKTQDLENKKKDKKTKKTKKEVD